MVADSSRPQQAGATEVLFEGDENPERGNWTGKLDFLLSCLGYAVGLGNVWRFPYLCYKNGGGAFLIPYAVMLFALGIPLFLLELTSGQFSSMAPITMYRSYAPGMKGLGLAMFLATVVISLYYNMIVAWTIFYTYASMTSDLPWQYCSNEFNSANCFSFNEFERCSMENQNTSWWIYNQGRCINNQTEAEILGVSQNISKELRVSPSEEYLERYVLGITDGIHDMGKVQWGLLISLFIAWVVVGAALIKGVKSSGKVVYFTALFPYVVLVILLIRGVTLPGAYEGIKFYIIPDWSKLGDIKIWEAAAVQIFYSLSISSGGLVTLASYNKFHNNVIRDTLFVCIANCLTSVFAGFAIFSVLGFMAHELDVPVPDVVSSSSGLAFIAYPDLVTRLPASPLWALLFFFMLFTLGLDSQFASVENIITCILDEFPKLRAKKPWVVVGVCIVLFLLGIPMTMQGGRYVIELLDTYAAGWPFLFIGLSELLVMYWVYGIKNFFRDLANIQNFKPGMRLQSHMVVVYGLLAPVLVGLILLLSWTGYQPLVSGDYVFPDWANGIGWGIAMAIIAMVPLGFLHNIVFEQSGCLMERLRGCGRATDRWYAHSEYIAEKDKAKADAGGYENLTMQGPEFYEFSSKL